MTSTLQKRPRCHVRRGPAACVLLSFQISFNLTLKLGSLRHWKLVMLNTENNRSSVVSWSLFNQNRFSFLSSRQARQFCATNGQTLPFSDQIHFNTDIPVSLKQPCFSTYVSCVKCCSDYWRQQSRAGVRSHFLTAHLHWVIPSPDRSPTPVIVVKTTICQ